MGDNNWFWTRRFHSLTIGGNGGALVMIAGFLSTYDDPFAKLGEYSSFMSWFLLGLIFSALAAYMGMQKEYHFAKTQRELERITEANNTILDVTENSEEIVASKIKLNRMAVGQFYLDNWLNRYNMISGIAFMIGCFLLAGKTVISP